jgi:hypothetical protein
MCCMSGATRTQVYLTAGQRAGLDERARVERKTMAHVIRDAVDTYLAADIDAAERDRMLAATFGSCPGLGEQVPSRDEWERSPAGGV